MDPKAALVGMVCGLVVVLPIMLWIGSVILRAAIGLTNRVLGGATPSDLDYYDDPSYYRNGRYPQEPTRSGLAIPMPSSGRAMGIVVFIGVVDFVVRLGIMMAAGAESVLGAQAGNGGMGGMMAVLIAIPVSLVVHITMLSSLLPTTIGRACLVLVFQFLIVLLVCLLIGAAIVALAVGMAPR